MKQSVKQYHFHSMVQPIVVTRYPQFIIHKQYKTLPQPYPPCKPEKKGWRVYQLNWFIEFVRSIEQITIKYFETIYPCKKSKTILYLINKAKKVIPSSCRIAHTFFTPMNIIEQRRSCNCFSSVW